MRLIAIDPGSVQSAYVVWDGKQIIDMDIEENEQLLLTIEMWTSAPVFDLNAQEIPVSKVIIEQVANMGMAAVGESIFETVFWSGRFAQVACDFDRMKRGQVKMHLCGSMQAKDANIRQALIDRFEPNLKPRQRPKGPLKGVSKDIWAALALAVAWWELNVGGKTK